MTESEPRRRLLPPRSQFDPPAPMPPFENQSIPQLHRIATRAVDRILQNIIELNSDDPDRLMVAGMMFDACEEHIVWARAAADRAQVLWDRGLRTERFTVLVTETKAAAVRAEIHYARFKHLLDTNPEL